MSLSRSAEEFSAAARKFLKDVMLHHIALYRQSGAGWTRVYSIHPLVQGGNYKLISHIFMPSGYALHHVEIRLDPLQYVVFYADSRYSNTVASSTYRIPLVRGEIGNNIYHTLHFRVTKTLSFNALRPARIVEATIKASPEIDTKLSWQSTVLNQKGP